EQEKQAVKEGQRALEDLRQLVIVEGGFPCGFAPVLDKARSKVGENLFEDAVFQAFAQRLGVAGGLIQQPVEETCPHPLSELCSLPLSRRREKGERDGAEEQPEIAERLTGIGRSQGLFQVNFVIVGGAR